MSILTPERNHWWRMRARGYNRIVDRELVNPKALNGSIVLVRGEFHGKQRRSVGRPRLKNTLDTILSSYLLRGHLKSSHLCSPQIQKSPGLSRETCVFAGRAVATIGAAHDV